MFPYTASAGATTCLGIQVTAAAKTAATAAPGAASSIVSVPSNDLMVRLLNFQGVNAAEVDTLKECLVNGLTQVVAQNLLHGLTQSTVNWINSGFRDKPTFVTNPEGFLTGVANKTIGNTINRIAPMLCTPFRLQVQLSLGLQTPGLQEEVGCQLSDVLNNVQGSYQDFVGGNFSRGGWQSWLSIAGTPQNNAYGSALHANAAIQASVVTATGEQIKLLDRGQGFLSWRDCLEWEEIPASGNSPAHKGNCLEEGPIKTPGSVILGQATGALGSELRELEAAKDIDAVIGALANQLLKTMMGSGGLAGTRPSASIASTVTGAIQNAAAATGKPDGILCTENYQDGGTTLTSPAVTKLKNGTDTEKTAYNQIVVAGAANILLVRERDQSGLPTGLNTIAYDKATGSVISKPAGTSWSTFMSQISVGCANEANQAAIKSASEEFSKGTGVAFDPNAGATTPQVVETNLASNKKARQSTTQQGYRNFTTTGPQSAVDSIPDTASYGGVAMTQSHYPDEWWQVDLATESSANSPAWTIQEINAVTITAPNGDYHGYGSLYHCDFKVYITKDDPSAVPNSGLDTLDSEAVPYKSGAQRINSLGGNAELELSLASPVVGRFVKIAQSAGSCTDGEAAGYLMIGDVQVFGKRVAIGSKTTNTSQVFALAASPANGQLTGLHPGDNLSQTVQLTARNKEGENISLRISLQTRPSTGATTAAYTVTPFSNLFTSFKIARGGGTGAGGETPNFIIDPCYTSTGVSIRGCTTPRSMNTALNSIGGNNVQVATNKPIVFAQNLTMTPNADTFLTLSGTLTSAASASTAYKLVVDAFKPASGGNGEQILTTSSITFGIAK